MKKGCFLKFIIIFTIFVAAILYLVQNKFDEFFVKPGKKILLSVLNEKWDEELSYVKDSIEKDSLKILINEYLTQMKSKEDLTGDKTSDIIGQLGTTVQDSIVDASELLKMRNIIRETLKNDK
ncbi:hypothetical protein LJE86_12195 [bacterium BMS3Abin03]|nr:hypothetical protein [bacterium BMS3Abin03]